MYKKGSCWEGYVQAGMKKKGNRMVPNCVPAGSKKMAEGGLTKWFKEKWVDIGSKKMWWSDLENVEENLQVDQKENTQNACLLQKPPE